MKKVMLTSVVSLATAFAFGQGFFPENSLVVSRINGTTSAAQSVDLVGFNYDGSSNSKVFNLSNLTMSGSATSEGQMNASAGYLALAGYSDPVGTTGVASGSTARRVAVFDNAANGGLGGVTYTDLPAGIHGGNNIRSAYTEDGTTLLTTGGVGGWVSTTGGVSTQLGTTTNTRVIKVHDGVTYGSTSSGTRGIYSLSGSTQTAIALTGSSSSPYDFEFYSENSSDYLFIADDGSVANGGGLQVWKNGSLLRTIVLPSTTSALRSLAVRSWDNNGVLETTIFGIANGNKIVGLTFDKGTLETTTSSFTELATASTGTVFRSIEVVPEPASMAVMALGIAGLAARRRRNKK